MTPAEQAYITKYKARFGRMPPVSPAPGPRAKPIAISGGPVAFVGPTGVRVDAPKKAIPPRILPVMPPQPIPPFHLPQPPVAGNRGWRGRRRPAHRGHGHSFGHRPRPVPLPVMPPTPAPTPTPITVAPPAPVQTGPICPSWGWMVSTNPDGSETVHQCQPGQHAAAGLHDFDLSQLSSSMGTVAGIPTFWLVAGAAAYFLFLKKRR